MLSRIDGVMPFPAMERSLNRGAYRTSAFRLTAGSGDGTLNERGRLVTPVAAREILL